MNKDDLSSPPSKSQKRDREAQQQRKTLGMLLVAVSVLVGFGIYMHLNTDQSNPKTEAFFEARKHPEAYYEYKETEEDAKTKAQRNIFLQN